MFLKRLIGTKEQEDASMDSATTVLTGFSVALIVCSVLEAASYYIYNRKVLCVVAHIEIDLSIS